MKRRLDLGTEANQPNKQLKMTDNSFERNPYNGKQYSQQYYDILEKRKTLPVWEQREEFLKMFKENQVMILQGETGSGKTTQVRYLISSV